ncbi:MAG TPA: hypothetical protein DEP05_01540 [Betaproteobacteria bacterium]|nr:hypothetical protein [Betaproteobacteria bacterium]
MAFPPALSKITGVRRLHHLPRPPLTDSLLAARRRAPIIHYSQRSQRQNKPPDTANPPTQLPGKVRIAPTSRRLLPL